MGEPRSQDRIAAVANVTPVTIRNHYKELLDLLGLPKNLTNPQARGSLPAETGEKVAVDVAAAGHWVRIRPPGAPAPGNHLNSRAALLPCPLRRR